MISDGSVKGRGYLPVFLVLIAGFLLIRIWILFLSPAVFHEGELYRGTIAKEILEGRSWPLFAYQNSGHEGGSLIVGIIASLVFSVFGQSILALKSVSLFFSLAAFITILLFLRRYYIRDSVIFSGLFMLVSLPFILINSVITMGDYHELVAIDWMVILLFFRIFFEKNADGGISLKSAFDKRDCVLAGITGCLSGLGLYFSYAHIILLAALVTTIFILDKRVFIKVPSVIFMLSFLAGFSPWFIYNYRYGFRGLYIHEKGIIGHFSLYHIPGRIKYLLFDYFPGALNTGSGLPLFSLLFCLVLISSLLITVYLNRGILSGLFSRMRSKIKPFSPDVFLLIYIFIFILSFSLSDFRSSAGEDYTPYKYLFTLFPFLFLLAGITLGKVRSLYGSKANLFVFSAVLFMMLPSAIFVYNISRNDFNHFLFSYKPYSYELMGCNCVKFEPDRFRQIDLVNMIPENHRAYAFKGLGNVVAADFFRNPRWYKKEYFLKIDKRFRQFFFLGLGAGLGEAFPADFTSPYQAVLNNVPLKNRGACYTGIGVLKTLDRGQADRLINRFDSKNIGYFYRGVGIGIMELSGYNIDLAEAQLLFVEESYRPFCLAGIGSSVYFKEYRPESLRFNRDYRFP